MSFDYSHTIEYSTVTKPNYFGALNPAISAASRMRVKHQYQPVFLIESLSEFRVHTLSIQ
jgi:hypothetical protein